MRPCRSGVNAFGSIGRLGLSSCVIAAALLAGCTSSSQVSSPTPDSKCTIAATANTTEFAPEGGSSQLTIEASRDCTWEVTTDADWVTVTSDSRGQGGATVDFLVRSSTHPVARTASLKIADRQVTIQQRAAPCRYALSTNQASVPASGGSGRIDVTPSSPLCEWVARSEAPWISIEPAVSQRGNATFSYEALSWSGPPRRGDIVVGDQRVAVSQTDGCAYTFGPFSPNVAAAGGGASIAVQAPEGCNWAAASHASWVTVTGSGAGPGAASFNVSANTGPARTGTFTIAEHPFTVVQESGCRYAVNPANMTFAGEGGRGEIGVSASAECGWTATSDVSWIGISGGAGAGNGAIQLAVTFNSGPQRAAAVRVANQAVTITQPSGCSYTVNPVNITFAGEGGRGQVGVSARAECGWTATSDAGWIGIAGGAPGRGTGAVELSVPFNAGPQRTGVISVANQAVTITQPSGCWYTISLAIWYVSWTGAPGYVNVDAPPPCAWSATSNVPWVTIVGGPAGTGPGTVLLQTHQNLSFRRTGTLTIAGHTFTVTQDGI